jgi:uncharacterized tellurite resistance protein B-like protein
MLRSLRERVRRYLAGEDAPDESRESPDRRSLAVAALLVETLRADFETSAGERRQIVGSLQGMLGLDAQACEDLLAVAEQEVERSHDLHQFTSAINRVWSVQQKLQLLEELWRVAHADEKLHKYEEHLIRRIADLLHVPHSGFIAAKLRSRADMT